MKYMKQIIAFVLLMTLSAAVGCKNPVDAMSEELVNTMTDDMDKNDILYYDSADGWHVTYNGNSLLLRQVDAHEVWFIYSMSDAGNNAVVIKYVEGADPLDAIEEMTASWSDAEVSQSEDTFVGTEDKWGIWRSTSYVNQDDNIDKYVTAAQYNGGTLLIEMDTRYYGEPDTYVQNLLNNVIESIHYDDFADQDMYEGLPGDYTCIIEGGEGVRDIEYELSLYDNHAGTLILDENIIIAWGSKLYINDEVCEYEFKDNVLTFTYHDKKYEFLKDE